MFHSVFFPLFCLFGFCISARASPFQFLRAARRCPGFINLGAITPSDGFRPRIVGVGVVEADTPLRNRSKVLIMDQIRNKSGPQTTLRSAAGPPFARTQPESFDFRDKPEFRWLVCRLLRAVAEYNKN